LGSFFTRIDYKISRADIDLNIKFSELADYRISTKTGAHLSNCH